MEIISKNLNYELFNKYEEPLRKALSDDQVRYWHSISVAITCVHLAEMYGENLDDALVTGLLHDYCKCIPLDKMLKMCDEYGVNLSEEDRKADGCIHGFLAAYVCKKEFDISDRIKDAIYYHTCGRPNMNMLEKIVYMADFIEPLRRFRDRVSEIRMLTYTNIDKAIVYASQMNLQFLIDHNKFIHTNTVKTLEYYEKIVK